MRKLMNIRLKCIFVGAAILWTSSVLAQNDPWLGLEPVVEHNEGELSGMTTYRLYLYTPNETDFLVSCSGDEDNPLSVSSTSDPAWFQHEAATTAFATDVNPIFFAAFPEFAFDSWLTIGAEDNTAVTEIIAIADPQLDPFVAFNEGENLTESGMFGSAWFVIPQPASNPEAVAGADLKILVAQLTTAGDVSGQIQCQVFLEGINDNEFRAVLPIMFACNDPEALNYEPDSYSTDGCMYPESDGLSELKTSHEMKVYPAPAKDFVNVIFPEHLAESLIGAELQARSMDGRFVRSWIVQGSNQRIDLSDLASGQYVLSVNGDRNGFEQRATGQMVVTK